MTSLCLNDSHIRMMFQFSHNENIEILLLALLDLCFAFQMLVKSSDNCSLLAAGHAFNKIDNTYSPLLSISNKMKHPKNGHASVFF